MPPDECCVHTKTYLWQSSSGKGSTCFMLEQCSCLGCTCLCASASSMAQDLLSFQAGLCCAKATSLLSVFMHLMFPLDRKHFAFAFLNLSFVAPYFCNLSSSRCILSVSSKSLRNFLSIIHKLYCTHFHMVLSYHMKVSSRDELEAFIRSIEAHLIIFTHCNTDLITKVVLSGDCRGTFTSRKALSPK